MLPSVPCCIPIQVAEKAQIKLLSVSDGDNNWSQEGLVIIHAPVVSGDEDIVAAVDLEGPRIGTLVAELRKKAMLFCVYGLCDKYVMPLGRCDCRIGETSRVI